MAGFFSYEMKLDVFDHYAYRTEPLKAAGEVALRIEQKHINSIIKQCKRVAIIVTGKQIGRAHV